MALLTVCTACDRIIQSDRDKNLIYVICACLRPAKDELQIAYQRGFKNVAQRGELTN